ncbi:MAG: hypothetical protein N3C57_02755 [Aquificaceae bacterium]|nr:hypothetical protein [Aquificaceae bacterium]
MFRAIEVCTDLTERKKATIKEVLTSYRKTTKKVASYQWKLFFQTGAFNRKANVKHVQIRPIRKIQIHRSVSRSSAILGKLYF